MCYLIVISRRQQVAQVKRVPVYVITGVAFLPLSSQSEAEKAVVQAKGTIQREFISQKDPIWNESDTSDDNERVEDDTTWENNDHGPSLPEPSNVSTSSISFAGLGRNASVAQDVIGRRGQYGGFAERWFSNKGWSTERRRGQGLSANNEGNAGSSIIPAVGTRELPDVNGDKGTSSESNFVPVENIPKSEMGTTLNNADPLVSNVANALLPKLLKTSEVLLSSRSFFFSYSRDITRRLGASDDVKSDVPLHKSVDPKVRFQSP